MSVYHDRVEAIGDCVNCGRGVCADCRAILDDNFYCQPCTNRVFLRKGKTGLLGLLSAQ